MNTAEILTILDDERAWLAKQPGMEPWDEGCRQVVALLESRLDQYSGVVCESKAADPDSAAEPDPDTDTEPDAPPGIYLARLARCLVHHWRDAVNVADDGQAEAARVAEEIAAGRGYRGGRKLGGDPLRDVVLAVAVVRKDNRATRVFQEDYFPFACALATKIHHRLAAEPGPWWSELLDHLAGYTRPKAKLDRFYGQCGLQNWLGRVFWRFLRRWRFEGGDGPELEDPPAQPEPPTESLGLFDRVVRQAVGELPDDDRLLLAWIRIDRLPNKQAAAQLGVSEGTASRRHEKALGRLQARIMEVAESSLSNAAWESVLEDMEANPQMFALVLGRALEPNASDQAC